jgi:type I restriction enzyme, S subunit
MSVNSIIKKSQLEGTSRIDAEYYQPEYLYNDEIIKNYKNGFKILVEVLKRKNAITGGATPLGADYPAIGIPFLRVQNVMQNYLDLSDIVYIGDDIHNGLLKRSQIKHSDVLLTITGVSYGKSATVPEYFKVGNINQHSVKIEVNEKYILPEFLSTFLNSKLGKYQTDRKITGLSRPGLVYTELKNILIPLVSIEKQREVKKLVEDANKDLKQSELLYADAEFLLLDELGLNDFKPKDELSYVVNLSEAKSVHRVDAEYFQPKYEKLISRIKTQKSKLQELLELNKLFTIRRGDFIDPDYYIEKAQRGYIRIKELPIKGDINPDVIIYIDDNYDGRNLETLQQGDFVFAGIGATLGKTARVPQELGGSFYSNNTARFRLRKEWQEKIDTYYLQIVLQSMVSQLQFKKRAATTAQAKIADEELKTVIIPVLAYGKQRKIADLVRHSHEARNKAKQLLDEAKQKVEEMIEG